MEGQKDFCSKQRIRNRCSRMHALTCNWIHLRNVGTSNLEQMRHKLAVIRNNLSEALVDIFLFLLLKHTACTPFLKLYVNLCYDLFLGEPRTHPIETSIFTKHSGEDMHIYRMLCQI